MAAGCRFRQELGRESFAKQSGHTSRVSTQGQLI